MSLNAELSYDMSEIVQNRIVNAVQTEPRNRLVVSEGQIHILLSGLCLLCLVHWGLRVQPVLLCRLRLWGVLPLVSRVRRIDGVMPLIVLVKEPPLAVALVASASVVRPDISEPIPHRVVAALKDEILWE